jgi:hypothetical protein
MSPPFRRPLGAGILLALVAAGCAGAPPPPPVPAMVALSENGDYGYSETALAPDLYKVTYRSPSLSAHGDPDKDYGLGGEKQRAADLATWRAAQLALAQGYPSFQLQSESRDLDVSVEDPPFGPPYVTAALRTTSGSRCRWDCDRPIGYWGDPYFNHIYDEWYRRGHSSGRASAELTVKLLPGPAAGALDAAATAERLRRAYAAATFDVR